jgi:ABC-type transport system involved in multi-copper enzyme maturation permease subunit
MTAALHVATRPEPVSVGSKLDIGGLLRSEWTKIRSLRSSVAALVLLVVVTIGFTALFVGLTVGQWDQLDTVQKLTYQLDPTRLILGAGFQLSQLAVCVLGVLVIANEYSSGTIRASLLAVPHRTPMLLAKAAVFAVVVFVVSEVAAFGAFAVGAPILHSKVAVGIGDPGVLGALLGAGLYGAVLGVFSIAIGAIVRHTAGGIAGIIAFVLVLAPLTQLIPGSIGDHVYAYLPTSAGQLMVNARQGPDDLLTPWQGFGVMCLWTAALMLLANYLLRRRDA